MINSFNRHWLGPLVLREVSALAYFSVHAQRMRELFGLAHENRRMAEIQMFGTQYLVRGSKLGLQDGAEADDLPRSPIEYYRSLRPTYYRSEGGGSLNLLKDAVKGAHPIFQRVPFACIESDLFSKILIRSFSKHIEVHSQEEFLLAMQTLKQEGHECYLDVSSWISTPEGLEEFSALHMKTPPYVLVGGIVSVRPGLLVFTHLENDGGTAERMVRRVLHSTGSEINLNRIPKILHDLGVSIGLTSTEGMGTTAEVESRNITVSGVEMMSRIQRQLVALKEKYSDVFYYSFILESLAVLQRIRRLGSEPVVLNALSNIEKNMSDPMEHYQVDLIFEEIFLLLSICERSASDVAFQDVILSQIQAVDGISPAFSLHSSGMTAFTHLLHSLYERQGTPLRVLCSNGSYFGYESVLKMHSQIVDPQLKTFSSSITNPVANHSCDVIVVDMHANNMTADIEDLRKMSAPQIRRLLVEPCLHNRTQPLTLVVDISTTLLNDAEVKNFILAYEDLIQSGALNVVFVTSLAKFFQCGLDKCTGGAVLSYGKVPLEETNVQGIPEKSVELLKLLALSRCQIPYKNESLRAKKNLMIRMKELIRTDPCFASIFEVIDPKDDGIPSIALRFKEDDGSEFFEKLALLSSDHLSQLGLLKRMSFSFMHPNVNACASTLRISAGLSKDGEQEQIISYLRLLSINIRKVMQNSQSRELLARMAKADLLNRPIPEDFQDVDSLGDDCMERCIRSVFEGQK